MDRADLRHRPANAFGVGGKARGKLCHVILPVSRHVENFAVVDKTVVHPSPIESAEHAEPPEQAVHRRAVPAARNIVHAGVEAKHRACIAVAPLAQPRVREAAGDDMLFRDDHAQPGVGEQCRGGQSAESGADHHDIGMHAGDSERGCRPAVALGHLNSLRERPPHESTRQNDG